MLKTWASERDGDWPAGSSPHMIEAMGPAEAVGPGEGAGHHSKRLTNPLVRGEGWDSGPQWHMYVRAHHGSLTKTNGTNKKLGTILKIPQ